MLSVDDIKKLTQVFATKQELQNVSEDLGQQMQGFRNEMLDRFDKVFGELKKIRQEQVFQQRTNERVYNPERSRV